jgi:hypothetical protein
MPTWIRFIEDLPGWVLGRFGTSPVYLGRGVLSTGNPMGFQAGNPAYVPLRRMTILTVLKRIERSKSSDWFLM